MRVAIAFAFLLFFWKQLFAQTNNGDNRRCQTLQVNIPFESSEIIDPASLNIADSIKSDLRIEIISARSFVVRGPDKTEKIEVCFRVLPSSLSRRFKLNAIPRYDSTALFRVPKNSTDPLFSKREELFDLGDINHGGQISRGISIGNTQDLFVNSSLNLNLEGQISEDLNIRW